MSGECKEPRFFLWIGTVVTARNCSVYFVGSSSWYRKSLKRPWEVSGPPPVHSCHLSSDPTDSRRRRYPLASRLGTTRANADRPLVQLSELGSGDPRPLPADRHLVRHPLVAYFGITAHPPTQNTFFNW